MNTGEECDDGNAVNTDDCDNACSIVTPTPDFNGSSVSGSVTERVKTIADTNHDEIVSDTEVLLVTLDVVEAPDLPYEQVQRFDVNEDGTVDDTDITLVLTALDALTSGE